MEHESPETIASPKKAEFAAFNDCASVDDGLAKLSTRGRIAAASPLAYTAFREHCLPATPRAGESMDAELILDAKATLGEGAVWHDAWNASIGLTLSLAG